MALCLEFTVGFVDRLQKLAEAGRLIDRVVSPEAVAQHIEVMLGKQPDSYDPFVRHMAPGIQRLFRQAVPPVTQGQRTKDAGANGAVPRALCHVSNRPFQDVGD